MQNIVCLYETLTVRLPRGENIMASLSLAVNPSITVEKCTGEGNNVCLGDVHKNGWDDVVLHLYQGKTRPNSIQHNLT